MCTEQDDDLPKPINRWCDSCRERLSPTRVAHEGGVLCSMHAEQADFAFRVNEWR